MKILKQQQDGSRSEITSLEEWKRLAPPKRPSQWKKGKSARTCAEVWLPSGLPTFPSDLRNLTDSVEEFRDMEIQEVFPELSIPFDDCGGEPRNADVAFLARAGSNRIAATVEAKAGEPFGEYAGNHAADALDARIKADGSKQIDRLIELARWFLPPRLSKKERDLSGRKQLPSLRKIRYQLLTATAGTISYAVQNEASIGLLLIHEFNTSETNEADHKTNFRDYANFLHRLTGELPSEAQLKRIVGPVMLPKSSSRGAQEMIPIYFGKVTTIIPNT